MAKWRDKPRAEQKADLNRYRAAKKVLNGYRNKERTEDATYRQANQLVIDAEREIPWRYR